MDYNRPAGHRQTAWLLWLWTAPWSAGRSEGHGRGCCSLREKLDIRRWMLCFVSTQKYNIFMAKYVNILGKETYQEDWQEFCTVRQHTAVERERNTSPRLNRKSCWGSHHHHTSVVWPLYQPMSHIRYLTYEHILMCVWFPESFQERELAFNSAWRDVCLLWQSFDF